jgi:cytochrome P450
VLDGRARQHPQLVPFSAGPAECPGRNLVLFTTSTVLAHMLSAMRLRLCSTPKISSHPLPMTLKQFTLDFSVEPLVAERQHRTAGNTVAEQHN